MIAALMRRDESGASVVTALIVSVVGLMLVMTFLTQVEHLGRQTSRDRGRTQAVHVAEAGVDRALSKLSVDPAFAGETAQVTAGTQVVGSYTSTVTVPLGALDDRTIVSDGVSTLSGQRRRVALTISLLPLGRFDFAQKSASTISAGSHLTVNGQTYSRNALTLPQHSTISGDVVSPESIVTAASSTINGLIWSGANVTVAAGTIVNGGVYATGAVTVAGTVTGDVRANSITMSGGGTISGARVAPAAYPAPLPRTVPMFVYSPANYVPGPVSMSSAAFNAFWLLNRGAMSGTYYITDVAAVTGPVLPTTLTGNLTIITAGRIIMTSGFAVSLSGGTRRLTLISTSGCCAVDSILWSGTQTISSQISIFAYSPGIVRFPGAKTFRGLIEAQRIVEDSYSNVTYDSTLAISPPPGFVWDLSSAGAYDLRPGVWRDCTATAGSC